MNLLLTGSSGQLGQELQSRLGPLGRMLCVDRDSESGNPNAVQQDLADLNRVEILLNRTRPDVIVNAAAYTAVDRAENEPDEAFRINAELPGCLARWAGRNERLLVHYSTDYVFDGKATRPYGEQDTTGPLNVYGESKLAGEWAIGSAGCPHFILRTSWVYSAHGNNFVLSMLRLARQRPALSVVGDQKGCPTWARNLAAVTRQVIERSMATPANAGPDHGIYHYCDANVVSWYDFARMIFRIAHDGGLLKRLPEMKSVESADFPQVARRPLYSVLDTSAIRSTFAIEPVPLEASLQKCLKELVTADERVR